MVLDAEMLNVKQYFGTNNIKLSDSWLENCTEWLRENNSSYTQKEMYTKIYEQWLLLDLRDVDVEILPRNVNSMEKSVLNGTYSLQLMCVVDISKPKLLQLQKVRNKVIIESNEYEYKTTVSAKRMLQLTLTDGLQEVKAIEYKLLKCLHNNLTPGMKIQIIGPINVRKGQILLEEHSVKLLGGEVEELLISNATENILASALNLPLNPKPVNLDEAFDNTIQNSSSSGRSDQPNKTNCEKKLKTGRNLDDIKTIGSKVMNQCLKNINIEEEVRIANSLSYQQDEFTNKRRKISKTPDLFDDADFDDALFDKIDASVKDDIKNEITPTESKNVSFDLSDIIDDKLFADINLFEIKKEFISITEFKTKYLSKQLNGIYKINAKFKNIVEKLTVNDNMWYLKITVEDDSDDLDVLMHNDVITELIGYTSQDMMKLKSSLINKDQGTIDKVMKAIDQFRNKIIEVNCIMEIEYKQNISTPLIIKLFGK